MINFFETISSICYFHYERKLLKKIMEREKLVLENGHLHIRIRDLFKFKDVPDYFEKYYYTDIVAKSDWHKCWKYFADSDDIGYIYDHYDIDFINYVIENEYPHYGDDLWLFVSLCPCDDKGMKKGKTLSKMLIDRNIDLNKTVRYYGCKPIMIIAKYNDLNLVKTLVEKGVDLIYIDYFGRNIMDHYANSTPEIIQYLNGKMYQNNH